MIPEAELKAIEARSVRYSERLLPLTEGYFEDREAVRAHYKAGALEQRNLDAEAVDELRVALIQISIFDRPGQCADLAEKALAKYEALKGKA